MRLIPIDLMRLPEYEERMMTSHTVYIFMILAGTIYEVGIDGQ
jgi:hypothetical protein